MPGVTKDRTLPANGIPRLDSRDVKAKLYYEKLIVSPATAGIIAGYYHEPTYDVVYDHTADPLAGIESEELLSSLGIHRDDLNRDSFSAMGRWFTVWSMHKDKNTPPASWSFRPSADMITPVEARRNVSQTSRTRDVPPISRLRSIRRRERSSGSAACRHTTRAAMTRCSNGFPASRLRQSYTITRSNSFSTERECAPSSKRTSNSFGSMAIYGRRLRLDVFLKILVTDIIPLIFQKRAMITEEERVRRAKYAHLPGCAELMARLAKGPAADIIPFIAYLPDDEERQIRGCEMVLSRQIATPTVVEIPTVDELERITCFEFACHSSIALDGEVGGLGYTVQILINGVALCECQDFVCHGWSCKHIRAGLALLDQLRRQRRVSVRVEDIPIPPTRQQAVDLQIQLGISSRGRVTALSQAVSPTASLADDLREIWTEVAPPAEDASEHESQPNTPRDSDPASDVDMDVELPSPLHLPDFDAPPSTAPAAEAGPVDSELEPVADSEAPDLEPTPTLPSATAPSAAQAFEAQAVSRLLFELPKVNHTLSSLLDILQSSRQPTMLAGNQVGEAEQFLALLGGVETQIRRRLEGGTVDTAAVAVGTRRTRQPDDVADGSEPKRARLLLPPSPEKSQRRKDSHSVV
uniref:SWIM-type domain-containing protein n=1 Tax=Mycena chlorophos TaxID=658473 RepID=A0ABQ0LB74_MYCCL|nr:predicted protein [Mycena chlorophos]